MGMQYPPPPPASPPPAQSNSRTIIIVVVVVLVLCCCCSLAGLGYWLYNNGDELIRQMNSISAVPHNLLPLA